MLRCYDLREKRRLFRVNCRESKEQIHLLNSNTSVIKLSERYVYWWVGPGNLMKVDNASMKVLRIVSNLLGGAKAKGK